MTYLAITLLLIFAATGAALLAVGLRGRRVNDHPHCRRCRFDLSGIDIGAEDAKCPECGGALGQAKAIRIGMRRFRPRVTSAGVVLILTAAALCGVMGWSAASGYNWNTVKPEWMLEIQSRTVGSPGALAAAQELSVRALEDRLSSEAHRRLARRGVDAFTEGSLYDPARRTAWGNIVETSFGKGLIDVGLIQEYFDSIMAIRVEARPIVRPQDKVPIQMIAVMNGSGQNSPGLVRRSKILSAGVSGVEFFVSGHDDHSFATSMDLSPSDSRATTSLSSLLPHIPAIQPGDHVLQIVVRHELFGDVHQGSTMVTYQSIDAEPLHSWTEHVDVNIRVVPPGEDSVVVDRDPKYSAMIQQSFDGATLTVYRDAYGLWLGGSIRFRDTPISVAGQVLFRVNGRIVSTCSDIYIHNSTRQTTRGFGVHCGWRDELRTNTIDIIIRPDPDIARRQIKIDTIWAGEDLVFTNVAVQWPVSTEDEVDSELHNDVVR